jgi:hypothetical protein
MTTVVVEDEEDKNFRLKLEIREAIEVKYL